MDDWYATFRAYILDACANDDDEARLFTSLLATCSPNSGVRQNALNGLLNYRSLSQGLRPRFGTYPLNSLINFLAGVLGRPSGCKVRAFTANLVAPGECIFGDRFC
jgi:hypothetical protein